MKTYRDAEGRDYYLKEGEIHYVDSGYHIVSMPTLDELKQTDSGRD